MINKEKWYRPIISKYKDYKKRHLVEKIGVALSNCTNKIPVIVVSYNNGVYVKNTVNQLSKFKIKPIIIDNNSKDKETLSILNEINESKGCVVFSKKNFGHMVGFSDEIYNLFPDVFAYTDPDLQFNKDLPDNFLKILSELTREYSAYKAGFALDLLPDQSFTNIKHIAKTTKPISWHKEFTIRDIEAKYWRKKINNNSYDIYCAKIDTTFAVYRKSNYEGDFFDGIRVAGIFSAIHLPWFPKIDIMNKKERKAYLRKNLSTTSIK